MTLTLQVVEAIAPDQSSLKAASKLMKPATWPVLARDDTTGLIWGECQGAGANPYRVMADRNDHGYKCTCPSRKFPCKHVLALMWMCADSEAAFKSANVPDWVGDWVGRRRKASGAMPGDGNRSAEAKSVAEAQGTEGSAPVPEPDLEKEARRKATVERRARETRKAIAAGLEELEHWIGDQLRLGLTGCIAEISERCRKISARLIDAKATALGSRLDELPGRILELRAEERPDALIRELGKIVLLTRAWRAAPDDPEIARAIATSESRDEILADATALRINGVWEVLAERVSTGRDGLVAQATWILQLVPANAKAGGSHAQFALLLDFFPPGVGRRSGAFAAGERFAAELAFYLAFVPLRAFIVTREGRYDTAGFVWPTPPRSALAAYHDVLDSAPWTHVAPLLLPAGRLGRAGGGEAWWRPQDSGGALPLAIRPPDYAYGVELRATAALWNGIRCSPLMADTEAWGRITFDG